MLSITQILKMPFRGFIMIAIHLNVTHWANDPNPTSGHFSGLCLFININVFNKC